MRLLILLTTLFFMSIPSAFSHTLLSQPMQQQIASGTLYGTLLLPKRDYPVPIALIIAGSGPTDRDGNNPQAHSDTLKKLAYALARQGVASLRYDKRGIAASRATAVDERQLSLEGYVEDALSWSRTLKADPRFGPLLLVGHSEGALIASLAAPRSGATALISLAGSGRPIDQLLREQLQGRLPPPLLASAGYLLDELKAGRQVPEVPDTLDALFRPSVQPYLISLLRQDPARAMANAGVPTLIVQGLNDIQVQAADARRLHAARPDAQLSLIEGMNHMLRIVPEHGIRQLASYDDAERPIAHELLKAIGEFLRNNAILPA
ncbi:alpha/beta fold hydrolase [Pseudomonas sp. ABC1]|uniref:alpha/beta hydrolase n=1 Tax=Pseudomonas sp. ABC1 TaxID=2748080 RepID=UPI0015C2DACA|nr:alpha/beta fold hydrolase [Pseudomonas sp. ABC1]QLF94646.1 alpha/beta fold hydrolase [Pseudomonas sp. ABC1]